jgi:predicted TIM-barrel fold metal-dependent hydrolase
MFERPSRPRFAVPAGSCDCHVHVFGPHARYPLARERLYTPDPALISDLLGMLDGAGVARAVLIQPSTYGTDNSCMLDAMAAYPDRLRGVVVIDSATPEKELKRMHALGARGTRLNLATGGCKSGAEATRLVEEIATRIAPLGWHVQIFATLDIVAAIAPVVPRLPVEVVFDHMGMAQAARGLTQPGLSALLRLIETGRVWVKLSGTYRVCGDDYGNADVTALARALIAANKDRVVWASDWPHTDPHARRVAGAPRMNYRRIDYGRLLSALADWAEGDNVARILVHNPARLYDFR